MDGLTLSNVISPQIPFWSKVMVYYKFDFGRYRFTADSVWTLSFHKHSKAL